MGDRRTRAWDKAALARLNEITAKAPQMGHMWITGSADVRSLARICQALHSVVAATQLTLAAVHTSPPDPIFGDDGVRDLRRERADDAMSEAEAAVRAFEAERA